MEKISPSTLLQFCPDFSKKIPAKFPTDRNLFANGLLDSFSLIDLVSELEDIFSLGITPEDITEQNFQSLDSICKFINGKKLAA